MFAAVHSPPASAGAAAWAALANIAKPNTAMMAGAILMAREIIRPHRGWWGLALRVQ